jgi:hypothetical protein
MMFMWLGGTQAKRNWRSSLVLREGQKRIGADARELNHNSRSAASDLPRLDRQLLITGHALIENS